MSSALSDVGSKVDAVGRKTAAGGMALLGFAGAVSAGLGGAIKLAVGFEAGMANVNSIAQLSTAEIANLSNEVLALAGPTAQAPATLAAGLYDIYSSGFQGAEALEVLEVSALAATAGLTTTEVSAKGVTSVLNAYGMEATEARRVSDMLFQTVNDGVLTYEQLTTNMGTVLPVASSLGVQFEELGAAYALMTLQGMNASAAETNTAALMRAAINPTENLTAAIQAQGYESATALIKTEGLAGFVKLLGEASGGSEAELFNLLGTQEAMNAALALGLDNYPQYLEFIERQRAASEGAGATQKALAKQMESVVFRVQRAKASFQAAAIVMGRTFLPAVSAIVTGTTAIVDAFLGLPAPVQRMIATVAAIAVAFTGLAGIIALVVAGTGPLAVGFGVMAAAVAVLLSPIGLLAAALVGLAVLFRGPIVSALSSAAEKVGAFFSIFKDSFDALRGSGASDVMDQINAWGGVASSTGEKVGILNAAIRAFADGLRAIGGDATPQWLVSLAFALDDLAVGADAAAASIAALVDNVASGNFSAAIGNLQDLGTIVVGGTVALGGMLADVAGDLWGWIKGQLFGQSVVGDGTGGPGGSGTADISLGDVVVRAGLVLGGMIAEVAGDLWGWVKRQVMGQAITGDGTGGPGGAGTANITLGTLTLTVAGYAWGAIETAGAWVESHVADGWDRVVELGQFTLNTVQPTVIGWIISAAGNVWNVVSAAAGWAWDGMAELGAWTLNTVAPAIIGWVISAAGNVWNVVKGAAGWAWDGMAQLGAWTLSTVAPAVIGWVVSAAGNVWNVVKGAAGWAWDRLADLGPWTLQTATPTVAGWVTAAAGNAWEAIKSAAGWAAGGLKGTERVALSILAGAVSLAEDFVATVDAGVKAQIGGQTYGPYQASADVEVTPSGGEGGGGGNVFFDTAAWAADIRQSVLDGLTSGAIIEPVRSATRVAALGLVATVYGAFQAVTGSAEGAREISISGIVDGLLTPFKAIGTAIRDAGAGISLGVYDAATEIFFGGTGVVQQFEMAASLAGVAMSVSTAWSTITDGIRLGITSAIDGLGTAFGAINLLPILSPKGQELLQGLAQGAKVGWDAYAAPWLRTIPALSSAAVVSMITTLYDKGAGLLQGLKDGAAAGWTFVQSDLAAIPAAAAVAVTDMSTTLYDTGTALIQGLQDGAAAKWEEFAGWIAGLENLIPGWVKDMLGIEGGSGAAGGGIPLEKGQVRGDKDFGSVPGVGGGKAAAFAAQAVAMPAPDFTTFLAAFDTNLGIARGKLAAFTAVPYAAKLDADATLFAAKHASTTMLGDLFAARSFPAKLDADALPFATQHAGASLLGDSFAARFFAAKLDADPAPFVGKHAESSALGDYFASLVWTGTLAGDNAPAAQSYNEAVGLGNNWAASVFTGAFAGDPAGAHGAADEAFGKGNAWASQVFTASFSVDTSGIENAVHVARRAAADISALLPNSPAKEGPLKKVPSFAYIADIARRDLSGLGAIVEDSLAALGMSPAAGRLIGVPVGSGGGGYGGAGAPLPVAGPSRPVYITQNFRTDARFGTTEDWDRHYAEKARGAELLGRRR